MIKVFKYSLLIAAILLFAFKGIYLKKLDAHKKNELKELNPSDFASKFWNEKLQTVIDSAVDLNIFLSDLKTNPQEAIVKYSKTKGITNTAYILVKGQSAVTDKKPDAITIDVNKTFVSLNIGNYFGNGVRDVTGLIGMSDFSNTMDYNNVSAELNKLVKTKIVEPLKLNVTKGQIMSFVGILELNKENIETNKIEILPIKISLK